MKEKYAIYQGKIGLRAEQYIDSEEGLKYYPYIKVESLPVIVNGVGGYTSFNLEYEKENGFLKIIEVDEEQEPLTREQRYPKNSDKFEYGWISPEGVTYNTGYEGHSSAADAICKELGFKSYYGERTLETKGWVKVTGSWDKGKLNKEVFVEDLHITKKQADKLFDLGLYETEYVPSMVHFSEKDW
jgi:hypothetical protein